MNGRVIDTGGGERKFHSARPFEGTYLVRRLSVDATCESQSVLIRRYLHQSSLSVGENRQCHHPKTIGKVIRFRERRWECQCQQKTIRSSSSIVNSTFSSTRSRKRPKTERRFGQNYSCGFRISVTHTATRLTESAVFS